jgi:hypothetical protein
MLLLPMKTQSLAKKLHKPVYPIVAAYAFVGVIAIGVLSILLFRNAHFSYPDNSRPPELVSPTLQTPSSTTRSQYACNSDADCTLTDTSNNVVLCCQGNKCANYSLSKVKAVNTSWLANQTKTLCRGTIECPMIPANCSEQIKAVQKSYQAKCVNNICQKIYSGQ